MSDNDTSTRPTRKSTLVFVTLLLLAGGLLMLLHGLGVLSLEWLHPNPKTPPMVFTLLGLFLLAGALLAVGQLRRLPASLITISGWTVIGIAMVVAHWLVFLADGTSCSAEGGGVVFEGLGLACRATGAAILILFDLILLVVLFGRRPNSAARPSRSERPRS